MELFLEILAAALSAFGLVCLGWLCFGHLVLPVGTQDVGVRVAVTAKGDGAGLEQTVEGLLWLRRTGAWRGSIYIEDEGLDPAGLALARELADKSGVELRLPEYK